MHLGAWIKKQLEKHNETQTNLSKKVGKSRSAVSNWIAGRFPPSIYDLIRICSFFAAKGTPFAKSALGIMLAAQRDIWEETV